MDAGTINITDKVEMEKFRRKLLISTRVIAFLLVLAIVWIGYVQMNYAKEVSDIKSQYGSLGYCYMCGLETYRQCSCQYVQPGEFKFLNLTDVRLKTAEANVKVCESYSVSDRDDPSKKINFTAINELIVKD